MFCKINSGFLRIDQNDRRDRLAPTAWKFFNFSTFSPDQRLTVRFSSHTPGDIQLVLPLDKVLYVIFSLVAYHRI